jgi:DNA-directed RNA polymerase subunit RPC12/RpoP
VNWYPIIVQRVNDRYKNWQCTGTLPRVFGIITPATTTDYFKESVIRCEILNEINYIPGVQKKRQQRDRNKLGMSWTEFCEWRKRSLLKAWTNQYQCQTCRKQFIALRVSSQKRLPSGRINCPSCVQRFASGVRLCPICKKERKSTSFLPSFKECVVCHGGFGHKRKRIPKSPPQVTIGRDAEQMFQAIVMAGSV